MKIPADMPEEAVEVVRQAEHDASLHWHYAGLEAALLRQKRSAEVLALDALQTLGNQLADVETFAGEMEMKVRLRTDALESLGIRPDGDPKLTALRDEAGNLRARKRQIESVLKSLCQAVRPWEAVER